jgi:hypothetical protein
LPEVAWRGYPGAVLEPSWLPSTGVTWLAVAGVAVVLYRRREPNELTFWLWMLGAILLSAPFVYFDDGRRVLSTSYVCIYLFFAMAFSTPRRVTTRAVLTLRPRTLSLAAGLTAAALVLVPAVSHVIYKRIVPRVDRPVGGSNDMWIWGRYQSGFLVVADGAPLETTVPSLHFSEFRAIVNASLIETYQGLLTPASPPLPFGFIAAPRLDDANSEYKFIVPPVVLERRDVGVWRLTVEEWRRTTMEYGPYWYRVTDATAVR